LQLVESFSILIFTHELAFWAFLISKIIIHIYRFIIYVCLVGARAEIKDCQGEDSLAGNVAAAGENKLKFSWPLWAAGQKKRRPKKPRVPQNECRMQFFSPLLMCL